MFIGIKEIDTLEKVDDKKIGLDIIKVTFKKREKTDELPEYNYYPEYYHKSILEEIQTDNPHSDYTLLRQKRNRKIIQDLLTILKMNCADIEDLGFIFAQVGESLRQAEERNIDKLWTEKANLILNKFVPRDGTEKLQKTVWEMDKFLTE